MLRQRHLDPSLPRHHATRPGTRESLHQLARAGAAVFPVPLAVMRGILGWMPFEAEFRTVISGRDNKPYPFAARERLQITSIAVVILVGLAALCWSIGANPLWALLYHITLVFVMMPLVIIRQWVEHYNGDDHGIDARYFYVRSTPVERFLLSPMNFNFHGVHHHYPSIPYYNLPALQSYLAGEALSPRAFQLFPIDCPVFGGRTSEEQRPKFQLCPIR